MSILGSRNMIISNDSVLLYSNSLSKAIKDNPYKEAAAAAEYSQEDDVSLIFAICQLSLWIINLAVSLSGLLFSLFLTVSHQDL